MKRPFIFLLKKVSGFTLIELIVFIVGLGVLASVVLLPLMVGLRSSSKGFNSLAAYEIAKGRIDLIRMQSRQGAFSSTQDMCAGSSPPAVCAGSTPAAYTVTSSFTAAPSPYNNTANYMQLTVTVNGNASVGNGYAQVTTLLTNY